MGQTNAEREREVSHRKRLKSVLKAVAACEEQSRHCPPMLMLNINASGP